LNKYFEFRSDSLSFQDDKKIQRHFDNVVKWNYQAHFNESHSSMLEIGCYLGYTLISIQQLECFNRIEAIEISETAANLAIKKTGLESIYCDDAFNFLPQKENKYDVIIMKAVLEHIPKDKIGELLKLIYNSMKNDGIALISVPNMDWIGANHERYMDFTHEIGFTVESLKDIMNIYFDDAKVRTMKYDFVNGLMSYTRIKILQPIVKLMVKTVLIILGQGAYRKTMYERSILAIGKKTKG